MGLARTDLKRLAMSAEIQTNFISRVLGSMMLRPGLAFLDSSLDNAAAKYLPFVFSSTDKALLEFTDEAMRVWVNDEPITRPSVTTAVLNGSFTSNLNDWTDADEAGAVSAWATGGFMGLTGTGTNAAYRHQSITPTGVNVGTQHALRIVVERGPVICRVGTGAGDDSYVSETVLETGDHSLAFTPTGAFVIQFLSRLARVVYVASCEIEASGDMEIPTPWLAADLNMLRFDQSGDVVFIACNEYQQWKIERRATASWSVVLYQADDGPFRTTNTGPITLTPSVLSGNGTLTASAPLFKSTHVGALFAATQTGQTVTKAAAALNDATESIMVTGVDTDRAFTIIISGMTGGGRTVILQRAFDNATWVAVSGKSWTVDTTESYDDGLDNETVYYRLLLSVVGAAGTTNITLQIATGSSRGIARVTAFTSTTVVSIEILDSFGATTATDDWEEGEWSDQRGFPSSVAIYEGRLVWAGKDRIWASASDDFYNYDGTSEGDSSFFSRTIGSGPVDSINWALPLQRLMLGGQASEFSCRSTSFDEPLTPTNANVKRASTQGSAAVPAVPVDSRGVYVQRGGVRVFELVLDGESLDYSSKHLTALVPEMGEPELLRSAVQRQPDTRVHFVRSDGTVALLVYDALENVICWLDIETDGDIEDVVTLPSDDGNQEDSVYYLVKRTINGATKRYLEKWAHEHQALGDAQTCALADSYVSFTNSPASTIVSGLGHLEGEAVVVWADGKCLDDASGDIKTFTVASGQISLTDGGSAYQASTGTVGLAYTAQFKSAKLSQVASGLGDPMNAHKMIKSLGVCLADVHPKGLEFGRDFTNMDPLPEVIDGAVVNPDTVLTDYNPEPIAFPGSWSTDARLCLQANAPRPVTVLAAVCEVEVHD